MTYRVALGSSAERAIGRIPDKVATAVLELAYGPLAENPQRVGKPLHLDLDGRHGARMGGYRVVYRIDEEQKLVFIEAVQHRSDVYRRR